MKKFNKLVEELIFDCNRSVFNIKISKERNFKNMEQKIITGFERNNVTIDKAYVNLKEDECEACEVTTKTQDQNILFATTTCPNCKIVTKYLQDKGIQFTKIYADEEPDKAKEYDIKKAPTLILQNGERLCGVSDIKKHFN